MEPVFHHGLKGGPLVYKIAFDLIYKKHRKTVPLIWSGFLDTIPTSV